MLEELNKEELIAEIEKICTKFEVVKQYFEIELSGDAGKYLQKAKKDIDKQFFTSAGASRNAKASRLNTITKAFEQISIYKEDVIELILYRIEQTIKHKAKRGELTDALHQSTIRVMARVQAMIAAEGLEEKYADRTKPFSAPYWQMPL